MQPDEYEVPPGELPRPQFERAPQPTPEAGQAETFEKTSGQSIEQGLATPQMPPQAGPTQPMVPPTMPTYPQTPTDTSQASGSNSSYSPAIADDSDLIEKEWVMKAKQIVEQTKDDPYNQTREINKMKADYLKKRYAKELKLQED